MTDEPNDSLEGKIDNVEDSEADDPETLDYYDPDEDDEVAETEDGTDDEDEAEGEDEPDDEGEDEQEADPQVASEIADDVLVKMPDGSTIKFGDLKESPMLKADHTRKTQELANERNAVKADIERMQRITESFVDHISTLIPDAPDASLALTDPNRYVAQEAQYKAAMVQVQKLIEAGEGPKEMAAEMNEAETKKQLAQANARLIEMFPEAAGGESREQFFNGVQSVANDLGFSNDELSSTTDPRVFALAHWAKKGMEADKAKATAKAKVAKAPPATPRKPGQGARKASGNAEAMRKLSRSGSLRDALAVDFD